MKKTVIIFGFIIIILLSGSLYAQNFGVSNPALPLKPFSVPMFGKDIIIHDQPDRDQRNIAVCSAFNGWLFATYSFFDGQFLNISILKSTDDGIAWEVLAEGPFGGGGSNVTKVDIVANGTNLSDLMLFQGVGYFNENVEVGSAYIWRIQPEPFEIKDGIVTPDSYIKDFALSTDNLYPAFNSNPYSVGILYSKEGYKDTLIFLSSMDGGLTFNNRRVVATSSNFIHKVALSYGRSPSWSGGRYFATWEEQLYQQSDVGHIFTSHTEPNINSPFTLPVCLDSLDPGAINNARNPIIACQFNDTDNDSANLTEIVMFEKYIPNLDRYDIASYYNLQATNSRFFRNFSFAPSPDNKLRADINFNPFNSTFMLTYFDSINHKLPFITHDLNMNNPDSWTTVSPGYNDNDNITSTCPKVKLNTFHQDGMNVWIADKPDGKGIALFDAPFSTYTGISKINNIDGTILFGASPNPCISTTNIIFEIDRQQHVKISIYNILGQFEKCVTNQIYPPGKHKVKSDIHELSPGTYIYTLDAGNFSATGKIIVL